MSGASVAAAEPIPRQDSWFVVVLAGALVLWASAFVGIRAAVPYYPPGALALLRFLVASSCLTIYLARARGFARLSGATRSDWLHFAVLGLTGVVVYHVALNAGELTVSAGAASLLVNTTPVFTVLLAAVFLGDRLGARGTVGLAIAFVGAALVSLGTGDGMGFDRGVFWILVAAVAQAIYFIVQKRMLERYGALELTTISLLLGTAALLVFTPQLAAAVRSAPRSATLVAVYLGVGPSALAYLGWAHVVSRIPVSRAVSFLYLVPVLAFALSWVALSEAPGLLSVIGGAATIAGVSLVHGRRTSPSR